jgi:hypothetical protein
MRAANERKLIRAGWKGDMEGEEDGGKIPRGDALSYTREIGVRGLQDLEESCILPNIPLQNHLYTFLNPESACIL